MHTEGGDFENDEPLPVTPGLETARLFLRPFKEADEAEHAVLWAKPELVMEGNDVTRWFVSPSRSPPAHRPMLPTSFEQSRSPALRRSRPWVRGCFSTTGHTVAVLAPSTFGCRDNPDITMWLICHPKLKNDLRRPQMEQIGDQTTVFKFGGLRDRQRDYVEWVLRNSLKEGVMPDDHLRLA